MTSFSTQIGTSRICRIFTTQSRFLVLFIQADKFDTEKRIELSLITTISPLLISFCSVKSFISHHFYILGKRPVQCIIDIGKGTERVWCMQVRV